MSSSLLFIFIRLADISFLFSFIFKEISFLSNYAILVKLSLISSKSKIPVSWR